MTFCLKVEFKIKVRNQVQIKKFAWTIVLFLLHLSVKHFYV